MYLHSKEQNFVIGQSKVGVAINYHPLLKILDQPLTEITKTC